MLPENLQIADGEKHRQFARTPFMCSFQAGWFKFLFSTVHIYFGASSGAKYKRRVKEIDKVAKFLARRARKDDRNHVLVGDFNIVKPGSQGFNALQKHGFQVVQSNVGSNKAQTKHYDQISFRVRKDELRFANTPNNTGVLPFFDSIYREEDFESYTGDLKATIKAKIAKLEAEVDVLKTRRTNAGTQKQKEKLGKSIASKQKAIANWNAHIQSQSKLKAYYLKDWRTFHGSDHLPLWAELEIDFSGAYLNHLEGL